MTSVDRRQLLRRLVWLMFTVIIGAFIGIFFIGLTPSSDISYRDQLAAKIESGKTIKTHVKGTSAWVTAINETQRTELRRLQEYVIEGSKHCALQSDLCVLVAATEREGIEHIYQDVRPPQLDESIPWIGGYVNPITGGVFDLLGRAYRIGQAKTVSMQAIE